VRPRQINRDRKAKIPHIGKNPMNSITLKARAKVNLVLQVLGKRRDGYHEIETLFERISLYDTIKISKIEKGIVVRCNKFLTKRPKDNLAYKAAEAILKRAKIKSGVKIGITKRIPVAAGLGGGSSDAAATLSGINRLFKLKLSRRRLMSIGSGIGADVPFFLLDAPFAVGRGIGDNLNIIESKRAFYHLLVCPGFKVGTKDVYNAFDSLPSRYGPELVEGPKRLTSRENGVKIIFSLTDLRGIEAALHNGLQRAAMSQNRNIVGISESLGQLLGKKFIVSGSGPSLFCLYGTRKEAAAAKNLVLRKIPPRNRRGWRLFVTATSR
jgi:4-diphosphocytidyl-2-C-methyl-D-erythritol kinase